MEYGDLSPLLPRLKRGRQHPENLAGLTRESGVTSPHSLAYQPRRDCSGAPALNAQLLASEQLLAFQLKPRNQKNKIFSSPATCPNSR